MLLGLNGTFKACVTDSSNLYLLQVAWCEPSDHLVSIYAQANDIASTHSYKHIVSLGVLSR